jgi:hypothetical protein
VVSGPVLLPNLASQGQTNADPLGLTGNLAVNLAGSATVPGPKTSKPRRTSSKDIQLKLVSVGLE